MRKVLTNCAPVCYDASAVLNSGEHHAFDIWNSPALPFQRTPLSGQPSPSCLTRVIETTGCLDQPIVQKPSTYG